MSATQMRAQIDQLLTGISLGYKPAGFIADSLFPSKGVAQYSGLIGRYGKSNLRVVNDIVGGRGKYRQVETRTVSTESYHIDSHGLTDIVTDEDYRNVVDPFDAERDATENLQLALQLSKEKGLADALRSTSVLTQNQTLAGTTQLSDYSNSDPYGVFKTAKQAIFQGSGVAANCAIMDWGVLDVLKYHPAILDKLGFKDNRAGELSDQELARALGVQRLVIADVAYNTAKQGQPDSMARMWGKDIIFAHIPTSLGQSMTTLGIKFFLQGKEARGTYKRELFNPVGATEILTEDKYDQVICDVAAGYLIKNAIA